MRNQSKSKFKSKTESAVNEEAEIVKSQLARALADYDNLVKRVERDRETIEKMVSLRLILKLLTVLDGLESAQEHLKDQGLAITIGEFKKVLSEEGLTEITPEVGEEFDENIMEVIEAVEGEEKGKVAELILAGWRFEDGTVVRHAKVKVYN